jgi:predicted dinucleotide-binding enzyme
MLITILGSGLMGSALGTAWARAGHSVAFTYSRDRAKLDQLARSAGNSAIAAAPNETVPECEVVLVSVPWHRLDDALETAGGADAFANKTVVTCSLPMRPDDSDLAIAHDTSGAEELARRLPGARVVAAFNTIPSELIRPPLFDIASSERPEVLICGDDRRANDVADTLARDAGFTPVHVGRLRMSRWVEPFGLVVGQLAYAQERGPALGYRFLSYPEYPMPDHPLPVHIARGDGTLAATVSVYGGNEVEENGALLEQFKTDAVARLVPGMAFAGTSVQPSDRGQHMAAFTFGEEHMPEPLEAFLEWLRRHPAVRLIEIQYSTAET